MFETKRGKRLVGYYSFTPDPYWKYKHVYTLPIGYVKCYKQNF